ncbi:MAG: four helix bundle protein [Candidatus Cloacimonadaceae bacterium]
MIHTDLEVYKRSLHLVKKIYQITSSYPKTEVWGLTNQMRRAAISIPSNIAEGSGRNSTKELIQYINIALGSLAELEAQLDVSLLLDYINDIGMKLIKDEITIIRKMLLNLKKSIKCT